MVSVFFENECESWNKAKSKRLKTNDQQDKENKLGNPVYPVKKIKIDELFQ